MSRDLIVIGGGSAGLTAAFIAGKLQANVLLVDKTRIGGDCTWTGCVPSKTLLASAHAAHAARTAEAFGVHTGEVTVDFAAVMERVWRIRAGIGEHETPPALEPHGIEVAFGGAKFLDRYTVQIGANRTERADKFVICTGSRAAPPAIPGLEGAGYLTNESVFELRELPARMVVIGGGPIGCELGQAFQRLGSKVTLLQAGSQLLAREEPTIGAHLAEVLREEGVVVHLSARANQVEVVNGDRVVHYEGPDGAAQVACDQILVAVGRRANVEELGLEEAGVKLTKRGIATNAKMQTSTPHIYAAGDCTGGPQFTHWAEAESRTATRNALFRGSVSQNKETIPWVTFTDPEVARVGLTEAEAAAKGGAHIVHTIPFTSVDRAITAGKTGGFIKVVVDDKSRVLGAHIIGDHAGELLPEWVLAIEHGLTLPTLGNAIHAYPTLNRANRKIADQDFFTNGVPGWKAKLFGTYRGRPPIDPAAVDTSTFIDNLTAFFRKPKEETRDAHPAGTCPNCWGRYEYDGEIRDAARDHQVDVNNHRENYAFIQNFAVTHVSGIRLREGPKGKYCPACREGRPDGHGH